MYEAFFGLNRQPFALTPDPAFLYPSQQHRMALTMLEYAVLNRSGFCLLTGEVGSGKTLLVRQLLSRFDDDVHVGLVSNTHRNFGKLMDWVCLAFGLDIAQGSEARTYQTFLDFILREYAAGRRVLLIVDEAQNLDADMLEELRVLSNVNADQHLVLQTILVGQPELRETLRRGELRQFAQRISIDYHLPALSIGDVRSYVRHRLRVAGGSDEIIDEDAIDLAAQCAAGIPRLINQLCDLALVYSFADQREQVSVETMRQVIQDRTSGGLFPGVHQGTPLLAPVS